jgi:hypothetical protein
VCVSISYCDAVLSPTIGTRLWVETLILLRGIDRI